MFCVQEGRQHEVVLLTLPCVQAGGSNSMNGRQQQHVPQAATLQQLLLQHMSSPA